MSRSGRKEPTVDEMDMLEAMMDRMGARQPSPISRPPSSQQAFPTRSSSRASSASRLSSQASSRSLQSLGAANVMPGPNHGGDFFQPRSPSSLSRTSPQPPFEGEDDETTPSMMQGEWGTNGSQPFGSHTRSRTAGSMTTREESSSIRSYASRDADASSNSYRPSTRSVPTSPTSRPRPQTSSGIPYDRTGSPLRLLPRSPLNNRTPLEDLTFFREVGALGEEGRWLGGEEDSLHSPGEVEGDTGSIRSAKSGTLSVNSAGNGRPSSLRTARLREDIEKEAQRIKERASVEEMRRTGDAALDSAKLVEPLTAPRPAPPPPVGSLSSLPLYPGAPMPANSTLSSVSDLHSTLADDSRSIRSLDSASAASVANTWPSPAGGSSAASIVSAFGGSNSASGSAHTSGAASARTEYGCGSGEGRGKTRQRESREWSQTCWVWQSRVGGSSGGSSSGGGGGKFSKAPLIRDVPSVMKRKSAKRESAHHLLSPAEAILFNVEGDAKKSSNSSKDKGKGSAASGASPIGREGGWRRATGVLRDDGYFRVFSDSDKAVIHSVHLPSLSRTDVRLVDHSLFGRPNCISLSRRQNSPSTPHRSSFVPTPSSSSSSSLHSSLTGSSAANQHKVDEPLYLCFPSIVATQVWLVMAHCFARSEYYLASGAATPRPLHPSSHREGLPLGYPSDSGTESESEAGGAMGSERPEKPDELDSSCRIYRSLILTINEGRALGELAMEVMRPGPKSSWERLGLDSREVESTASFSVISGSASTGGSDSVSVDVPSPAKLTMPRLHSRASQDTKGGGGGGEESGAEAFCEVEMGGDIVARTSIKKGRGPFWNETFTFSDLPPFVAPMTIRVLQSSKSSSRPHLLGTTTVRIPDLPRHELVEDWWGVKPPVAARATDVVGELSLSLRIGEEVVLPSRDYQAISRLLSEDSDAELASDIAHEFPSDLEEVTKILLRVYQADAQLVPRLLRLADLEVEYNSRNNRSAAILFRGNTILTKSVELYLRLIGAEYLDASIGEPIRRICAERVEIEIDPMKMKPGYKEKELQANIHLLQEWALTVWNSIYDAREKCPHDLRQIFGHIQRIVVEKYGLGEEQKNTRWTCVSAFIFLRFFVPAVLNPKLFFIVSAAPDPRSQRTLTLVAKTLQGLANFSSFGQKEPFMLPMNPFVQENTAAFVDFIEHISTAAPATGYRQEWTSPSAAAYFAPYRLRNSLAPLEKEGVPLLPHLIDLPRELGLLASYLSRFVAEKGPLTEEGAVTGDSHHLLHRGETPSIASSRGGRSRRFLELAEACVNVHAESRRRGGGLVSTMKYQDLRNKTPDPKTRARRGLSGRPATASSYIATGAAALRKSFGKPSSFQRRDDSGSEELHIRNPPSVQEVPPSTSNDFLHYREDSADSIGQTSTASRRNHRSFTINGPGAAGRNGGGLARGGSFPVKSFSTEDLSLLASIQTQQQESDCESGRAAAGLPTPGMPPSATMGSLSVLGAPIDLSRRGSDGDASFGGHEEEYSSLSNPGPQQPLFSLREPAAPSPAARLAHPQRVDETAAEGYSFPSARTRTGSGGPKHSSIPMSSSVSTRSNRSTSTTRSGQVVSPTPAVAPSSRIRITQETTTTTSYVSSPSINKDNSRPLPPGHDDDLSLAPTSNEDGTPYESSFGGFTAPLMRATNSQASARSMTSSVSSVSISTAGGDIGGAASPSSGGMIGGRRASSAGLSLGFGLGGRKGSGSGGSSRDDDASEGGGSSRSGGGGGKGLLSRAMGRKGSRAS
ncbi:hypothetical protein JCM11251_005917 [Rhodosporidiobolus azoricus]